MTDIETRIVKAYLQRAHDRGGGWQMAMNMMAVGCLYWKIGF